MEWIMQAVKEVGGREKDEGLWEREWKGLRGELRTAMLGQGIGITGGVCMHLQLGQQGLDRPSEFGNENGYMYQTVEVSAGKR